MTCSARLRSWSPPRLRRSRVRCPLRASSGAAPARAANAASQRTRPRWDQLTKSCAATIGPTPGSASRARPGQTKCTPKARPVSRESPPCCRHQHADPTLRRHLNTHSVLVRAALPRAAGVGEENTVREETPDQVVSGHLTTQIRRQRSAASIGKSDTAAMIAAVSASPCRASGRCTGRSIRVARSTRVPIADAPCRRYDEVTFEINEAGAFLHDGRALIYHRAGGRRRAAAAVLTLRGGPRPWQVQSRREYGRRRWPATAGVF